MGDLRKVEVCMAPSVVLSRPDASTMGNLVEQAILRDYLTDTSSPPPSLFVPPTPTFTHWWDIGDKTNYFTLLLTRHKDVNKEKLQSLEKVKVPDISTWKGKFLRNGQPMAGPETDRSELYEVKPDNVWGEIKGREKISIINDNYKKLGITGYKWGTWYPEPTGPTSVGRKQVHFYHYPYVAASLRYRLRRMERSLRNIGRTLRIKDVVIEIERRELGLLYYMICVHMELDFKGEDKVAKKVIQRLYEAMTTGLSAEKTKLELEFAKSLAPAGRDRQPRVYPQPDKEGQEALNALDAEEAFRIRAIDIVEELANSVVSLGQTLFTRLRGLPGEKFIVCSDEVYFNNEIMNPRKLRLARQIAPLQLRPPVIMGSRLALAGAIVRAEAPLLATIHVLSKIADDPSKIFTAKEEWLKAYHWLKDHPTFTLIVGSAVIYGAAIVIASGGAAGAAALYGEGAVSASALQFESGLGLARNLSSPGMARVALPAVEREVLTKTPSDVLSNVARKEVEALLKNELVQVANDNGAKVISMQARKKLMEERVLQAAAAAGGTFAAAALRMALAGGQAGQFDEATVLNSSPVALEVGTLYLLQLKDHVDVKDLPLQLDKFDYTKYSFESPGPAAVPSEWLEKPRPKELRYLGVLECT